MIFIKKVLIICYGFNTEKIGSVRFRGLTKYITNYGWKPTILTNKTTIQHDKSFKMVETEYLDLKTYWKSKIGLNTESSVKNQLNIQSKKNKRGFTGFILDMWVEIFEYPDGKKNWYEPAVKAGSVLLENEHFDVILSTSYPPTSHLIANELKKRSGLPWIADLRDLWTQNPYRNRSFIRNFFERRLELKTLNDADILTTISKPLEDDLKKLHKRNEIYTICNGFDPDTQSKDVSLNNKLNITYTGNLYNGKRDPEKLFQALNELKSDGIDINKFSVDFYGSADGWLRDEIKTYDLENIVNIHGMIPRNNALQRQRESQILLLLTWDNPKEYGTATGKIYEYLAAKRPILSIGSSKGVVKKIIDSTNSGVHLSDINEIKDQIYIFYNEFKINGKIGYHGLPEEIEKYSQIGMTKKFAHLLDDLTD